MKTNTNTAKASTTQSRTAMAISPSKMVTDGDGVRIQRNIANKSLSSLDPFLLLDEIKSDDAADYIGGFPEHPHRGFETVTYMLEGSMKHRDHMGNEGLISSGGVQWMTAGRGVLHSEMPQQESGKLHGFQLWINLPSHKKMSPPRYQEFDPEKIPSIKIGLDSQVKVIAGHLSTEHGEAVGPIIDIATKPNYFDFTLSAQEHISLPIDSHKRVLIYVYEGSITIESNLKSDAASQQELVLLSEGDTIDITANDTSRFLLLAAQPIGEPIVNWGPFVMNTKEEIDQAIQDYRNGNII